MAIRKGVEASHDLRIQSLRTIKENSKKPYIEIAQEIGVREATVINWMKMDSLDHINPGSKKLVDLFIRDNQRFLK